MIVMRQSPRVERISRAEIEREDSAVEYRRLLIQEKLILEVTEALSGAIEESGLTRLEIARRIGKSKGFVSQLLAGGRNLTLRTVADLADAIGISLKLVVEKPRVASTLKEGVELKLRRTSRIQKVGL
jgi:antitoxin component HigA of HigAB toxin-antitoxin module